MTAGVHGRGKQLRAARASRGSVDRRGCWSARTAGARHRLEQQVTAGISSRIIVHRIDGRCGPSALRGEAGDDGGVGSGIGVGGQVGRGDPAVGLAPEQAQRPAAAAAAVEEEPHGRAVGVAVLVSTLVGVAVALAPGVVVSTIVVLVGVAVETAVLVGVAVATAV